MKDIERGAALKNVKTPLSREKWHHYTNSDLP